MSSHEREENDVPSQLAVVLRDKALAEQVDKNNNMRKILDKITIVELIGYGHAVRSLIVHASGAFR